MTLAGPFKARIGAQLEIRRVATIEFNRRYATRPWLAPFAGLERPAYIHFAATRPAFYSFVI
jgi:hypothetical protein